MIREEKYSLNNNWIKNLNVPVYMEDCRNTIIGENIFIVGSSGVNDTYKTFNYKYNTLNNTYIQLANIPYKFYNGSIVSYLTSIYLLGGNLSPSTQFYKYDTLTNTYSSEGTIPGRFGQGTAEIIDDNIYIFKDFSYKYNITNKTWSSITNNPHSYNLTSCKIGNDIFLFGGDNTLNKATKYDTLTDTYTPLENLPFSLLYYSSTFSIDSDIYIINGVNFYKYDSKNNTYKNISTLTVAMGGGGLCKYKNEIFLINGSNNYKISFNKHKSFHFFNIDNNYYTPLESFYENGNYKPTGIQNMTKENLKTHGIDNIQNLFKDETINGETFKPIDKFKLLGNEMDIVMMDKEYTVTFDSNGGSLVDSQVVIIDTLVTEPTPPIKNDILCTGWYTDIELTNLWNFSSNKVYEDITLYAKY